METTTTQKKPAKTNAEGLRMVPAATEIDAQLSAKVDAFAAEHDRSRAYVLRKMIVAGAQRVLRGNG